MKFACMKWKICYLENISRSCFQRKRKQYLVYLNNKDIPFQHKALNLFLLQNRGPRVGLYSQHIATKLLRNLDAELK